MEELSKLLQDDDNMFGPDGLREKLFLLNIEIPTISYR